MVMGLPELVWYFTVYAFMGFVLETAYRSLVVGKLVYPGFLYGPWLPIYGTGLLVVLLLLSPFKGNVWLFLVLAFLLTSALEYVTGWLLETLMGMRLWDYREMFLNLHGRISLSYSLGWTALSGVFVYFIHPLVSGRLGGFIGSPIGGVSASFLLAALSVDTALSVNRAIYIKSKMGLLELLRREIEELADAGGERLVALREEYEGRMHKLLSGNRHLLVYTRSKFMSGRFPQMAVALMEFRDRFRSDGKKKP